MEGYRGDWGKGSCPPLRRRAPGRGVHQPCETHGETTIPNRRNVLNGKHTSGVWCPGEDSNLHALRHTDLNRARLPIPPPGLVRPSTYGAGRAMSISLTRLVSGRADLPTDLVAKGGHRAGEARGSRPTIGAAADRAGASAGVGAVRRRGVAIARRMEWSNWANIGAKRRFGSGNCPARRRASRGGGARGAAVWTDARPDTWSLRARAPFLTTAAPVRREGVAGPSWPDRNTPAGDRGGALPARPAAIRPCENAARRLVPTRPEKL